MKPDPMNQELASGRALRTGQRIPEITLRLLRESKWLELSSAEVFGGRTVIVFGLPGAFTPTCSSQHLPRYNELAPLLFDAGIDEILCVSVNDAYVMEEWARQQEAENITMVADGNGEFTETVGMLTDKRELGFGRRSWRYSMLVRDGVVEKMFVEPRKPGDPFEVSDADTMLKYIEPGARAPDEVAIFTREGCSHCARAKAVLEQAGYDYVELPLESHMRGRVVSAITGRRTVPQIFINGRYIGDADDLEAHLAGSRGARVA